MAKETKVAEAIDKLEKPFKGADKPKLKRFARLMGTISAFMDVFTEATEAQGATKRRIKNIPKPAPRVEPTGTPGTAKPKKRRVKKETAYAEYRKPLTREQQNLNERFGQEFLLDLNKTEAENTDTLLKGIQEISEPIQQNQEELRGTLLGPLDSIAGTTQKTLVGWVKEWWTNRRERIKAKKEKAWEKEKTKLMLAFLKDEVEATKNTDKELSKWLQNQYTLLEKQHLKETALAERREHMNKKFQEWQKKNDSVMTKEQKKARKEMTEMTRLQKAQTIISGMVGAMMNFMTLIGGFLAKGLLVSAIAGTLEKAFTNWAPRLGKYIGDALFNWWDKKGGLQDKLISALDILPNGIAKAIGRALGLEGFTDRDQVAADLLADPTKFADLKKRAAIKGGLTAAERDYVEGFNEAAKNAGQLSQMIKLAEETANERLRRIEKGAVQAGKFATREESEMLAKATRDANREVITQSLKFFKDAAKEILESVGRTSSGAQSTRSMHSSIQNNMGVTNINNESSGTRAAMEMLILQGAGAR